MRNRQRRCIRKARGVRNWAESGKRSGFRSWPEWSKDGGRCGKEKSVNAFAVMMQSARKRDSGGGAKGSDDGKKSRMEGSPVAGGRAPGRKDESGGARPGGGGGWAGKGGWSEALRDVALRPDRHRDEILDEEGGAVVIKDLYHKVGLIVFLLQPRLLSPPFRKG